MLSQSARHLTALFLAELCGTFFLVLLGDGSIASYVVKRQQVDLLAVCLSFGVGGMVATYIGGKISGAHINPAGTLASALLGEFRWSLVPIYMTAQYIGAFIAALLLYINYAEGIADIDNGHRTAYGISAGTSGHIFATYPAPYLSLPGSLFDQVLGTFALFFAISAISDSKNSNLEKRHQPIAIGLTIAITCVAFGANCSAIFNPARDLSPRVVTWLMGYREPSPWQPLDGWYWLVAGLIGPHLGAILAVFAYKYLISIWLTNQNTSNDRNNYQVDQNPSRANEHAHNSPNYNHGATTEFTSKTGYPESINYGPSAVDRR